MKTHILPLVIALAMLFGVAHFAFAQAPTSGTVSANANIRSGPGTSYPVVDSVSSGATVEITGCNTDCSWYEIGPDRWIAAFLITADTAAPQPTAALTALPAATKAGPITIVSWNVESGGALQNAVAERMGSFQDVDIWGLSEVNAIDAEAFEFGAEEGENANYESYLGTTGGADRLLLIWDEDRFELVNSGQMTDIGQGARSPLWVELRESATGLQFTVMVNHLHRSNEGTRHRQAQMLNAWAAGWSAPVIAIGDYNFDWNLPNGDADHDLGYDNMTKDGVWKWVRPAELVTTQCSGWPCGYNSVLDFVFVAGPAREWNTSSEIVVAENDFPDDYTTPDHRPVMVVIMPPGTVAPDTGQTALPTATATTEPACPQAKTNGNLRAGPGTGYAVVGSVQQGQCVTITGRTEVGNWFQVGPGVWIAAFLVTNPGPMSAVPVVAAPAQQTAVPPTATSDSVLGGCDPSYPTLCIPLGSPDLDCGEIPYGNFPVLPPDPHGFDGNDNDGFGCESNSGPSSATSVAPAQPTATPIPPTAAPVQVAPAATPIPPAAPQQQCDPNYAGACIPLVDYDLDCGEITFRRFQSIGSDPHNFDGDGDGLACES